MKKNAAISAAMAAALTFVGGTALAQDAESGPFSAEDFQYGTQFDLPEGEQPEIWNPAKRKLQAGGPLIGGTIRATDPRTYCSMANAGYDFTWVEMQHEATEWEQVARMWRTCPDATAAPGVRLAYADEREIQHATDSGALVVVVPTIDSVEEAQEAIDWTYFPPLGRRSAGGGQGTSEMWNEVPGGYRETWNANVVLVLMIETLQGVEAARDIAKLDGVDALFAASGDLGNFSGYEEGDPEYEGLISEVLAATEEAGIAACGPLRWAERPGFSCFQAGTEAAAIRRGAEGEIQEAVTAFGQKSGAAEGAATPTATIVADLTSQCGSIVYEADCFAAVEDAMAAAADLPAEELAAIGESLAAIVSDNPNHADRIREIVTGSGVAIDNL